LAKTVGGVKIAIDDFGSGYSNFERLVDFQPDILKIDGSLIKNIVDDSFSEHVVKAIVTFAKNENIQTVAEFVENKDILNKIKSLGIDYSQGFYIGKPDILD
jgi:EAL domain-containing protein (putative c-di-GMP-specific phosphodiesterase class I)